MIYVAGGPSLVKTVARIAHTHGVECYSDPFLPAADSAAEIALNGVREEARVGQRTTLDVLNAQQELVNARVALVTAQHDRVVASYTLLAAVGGLSMPRLGLNVLIYDPMVHYQQVRDAWIGVRNPDGR